MSRGADVAIGMMDTAYFVGRGELLEFFNNLLDLQLSKIEQTASGAIACQLTEYIYPKSIPMSRVNWEAKSDYEFVQNYKLLQNAFNKNKISRYVDVDKLIRAKYQDNLEFCQWLKAFYDQSGGVVREDYDASAIRGRGKGGKKYNDLLNKTASKHGSKPLPAGRNSRAARVTPSTRASPMKPKPRPAPKAATSPARRAPITRSTAASRNHTPVTRPTPTTRRTPPGKGTENKSPNKTALQNQKAVVDAQLMKKNTELQSRVEELETSILEIEKERDFYFGKLRNVELMLQMRQDKNFDGCDLEGTIGSIFKVLYATAEEELAVGEDGEIVGSDAADADAALNLLTPSADDDPAPFVDESPSDGDPVPETPNQQLPEEPEHLSEEAPPLSEEAVTPQAEILEY